MLVDEKLASADAVGAALEKQKSLRTRKLGEYLTANQIVSPEQLAAALKAQSAQPVQRLGETLVAMGYLTEAELEEALAIEARDRSVPLGQILADMGVLDAEVVNGVMARKLGIPFVSLKSFRVPPAVLKRLPAAVAHRYQVLVPSYTVMFAFFLVLNVGWVFVAERTHGTLRRLRATPITRGQLLLGKLVPYFLLSLGQGAFLLIAGRLLFGMRWGPDAWSIPYQALWLAPVIFCTSLAAMGLALLVASVARTETQVALYGAIPVLVLALIGGCVLPPEMMPEQTQPVTRIAPHRWALDAYRELLGGDPGYLPNPKIIVQSCMVLTGFGFGFIALAWWRLRLD